MFWHDLYFASPHGFFWLGGAAIFFFLYHLRWKWQERVLVQLLGQSSQREEKALAIRWNGAVRCGLLALCWVGMVFAWMEPRSHPRYPSEGGSLLEETLEERVGEEKGEGRGELRRQAHEVIFLLDVSASMEVSDTRLGYTRLAHAKEIIEEVVARLDGQLAAVYAFTSEVTTLSPPTQDYLFLRLMTRRADVNEGDVAGTDFLEALEFVKERHFRGGESILKTLVLLSDGGDTRLEARSGERREQELQAILSALGESEKENFRLFTVGMGSEGGSLIPDLFFEEQPVRSSLDEELLRRLSEKGRGHYYFANGFTTSDIASHLLDVVALDHVEVNSLPSSLDRVEILRERVTEREAALLFDEWAHWLALAAWLPLMIVLLFFSPSP